MASIEVLPVFFLRSQAINNALDTGARTNSNAYHVRIASPFFAFRRAAGQTAGDVCAAGLLTILVNDTTPCGVHPSVAGQFIIANKVVERVHK